MKVKLAELRKVIQESLRVQRGGSTLVEYVDPGTVLSDVKARQNHVIFARRGCGKTLLLHTSSKQLGDGFRSVYLNCEDFKRHSFPNVLIEILDSLFAELEKHLSGWFGRKRRSRDLIKNVRAELAAIRQREDVSERSIRETNSVEKSIRGHAKTGVATHGASTEGGIEGGRTRKSEFESEYSVRTEKLRELDDWLPRLKVQIREFFEISSTVQHIFLHIDDLYHLRREDQPFIVDYVHRLCKDLPIFFKIATLRHASVLYVDNGQPIGAQERHDFQPINIDYNFTDFKRTKLQNRAIFHEYGRLAGIKSDEMDRLFKGEGFARLVMAGGGVPRDTLSLFLEVLADVQQNGDGRIGKDDVRILSRSNFERRIEELKNDSKMFEQDRLIKAIYIIRKFCLDNKTNVFLIAERSLQQDDGFRNLIYRLLDYRIIHSVAAALTNKSRSVEGTFQAFSIDIGCYAHMRKFITRFTEIDLTDPSAKDSARSSPVLALEIFRSSLAAAPAEAEQLLLKVDD